MHVNFVIIFGGWSGYMLDRKIKHVAIFLKKNVGSVVFVCASLALCLLVSQCVTVNQCEPVELLSWF